MRLRTLWLIPVALVLVVTGCSTEDDGDGGEGAAAAACEPGGTDGDLVLYNWSEYIDPELITQFEQQYGVSVTEDFFPSNEDMLAKVSSGASGFDVVVPSDYMVAIMIEEGLLAELQADAIPNLANLDPEFTDLPFDPEGRYSVPYQWGTSGIAVDTNVVGEDFEQSWGIIFDPEQADAYSGKISMLNDPRESLGAALKYLGYSLNTSDPDELAEAQELLTETTARLATYDSDQFEDLLVGGETAVAHGWSGDFFRAFDEASTDDFDAYEQYSYFVPEEGGVRWVDNMAILADAPHPCTAHTFVDFMLDAENGAALTNFNFYASPNAAAEEFIDPEILEDPAIYPPEEVVANLEFIEDTGDFETQYSDAFTQAKG
ncbi:MAG: Spermidine/putrescine-binding periplasmic protein [Acidimicrobiales bacterium]|nr:MAG: spermidine/putrescine ABC transporter substrate-binding protein [Actinomycetota bacterium]MBV6509379.1 Spermidine/putrescine-binding periplasmic protein [Acidimicrobiales bacterium]RIK04588.1 MAG: polyamine ABC transporter substrate-binding protein [Acidobacteriota bacterium]